MFNNYKKINKRKLYFLLLSFLTLTFLITLTNLDFTYANENLKTVWSLEYQILENDNFIDTNKIDKVEIDHNLQEIRLEREGLITDIGFRNSQHEALAYSIMTNEGIKQYAFDGNKMQEINSFNMYQENPVAMALKRNVPNTLLATEEKIFYYFFDDKTTINAPSLEIGGYQNIQSMAMLDDNTIAILNENKISIEMMGEEKHHTIPELTTDVTNPIAIASQGNYTFNVLTEDKIQQFVIEINEIKEVPSFALDLFSLKIENPKSITAIENQITVIDNKNAYTFLNTGESLAHVSALSITNTLQYPMAVALHDKSKDMIILDHNLKENEAILRYFAFDGDKMTEIKDLSVTLEDTLFNGNIYANKGSLTSNSYEINSKYLQGLNTSAYITVEENTEVIISLNKYNNKDTFNNYPLWKIINDDGKEIAYKNTSTDPTTEKWILFGDVSKIYPKNLKENVVDSFIKKEEMTGNYTVTKGKDGGLYLEYTNDDEMFLKNNTQDETLISFEFTLFSHDGRNTPKIFVPSVNNKIENISDNVAFYAWAIEQPPIPIIVDVKEPDSDCSHLVDRKDNWVYSTTPIIDWVMEDNSFVPENFELVLMSKNKTNNWQTLYTTSLSNKQNINDWNFKIPTSQEINKDGLLYSSGSYEFAVFVRAFNQYGIASDFSKGKEFKVLAYERPRITNIVSLTNDEIFDKPYLIKENTKKSALPKAKAGTAITLMLDSVGIIDKELDNNFKDFAILYYDYEGEQKTLHIGSIECEKPSNNNNNRWTYTFWTSASSNEIDLVEGTIIKGLFLGDSTIGGRTAFCMPSYADGIVEISSTVYKDWQVVLEGRTRDNQ